MEKGPYMHLGGTGNCVCRKERKSHGIVGNGPDLRSGAWGGGDHKGRAREKVRAAAAAIDKKE